MHRRRRRRQLLNCGDRISPDCIPISMDSIYRLAPNSANRMWLWELLRSIHGCVDRTMLISMLHAGHLQWENGKNYFKTYSVNDVDMNMWHVMWENGCGIRYIRVDFAIWTAIRNSNNKYMRNLSEPNYFTNIIHWLRFVVDSCHFMQSTTSAHRKRSAKLRRISHTSDEFDFRRLI